MPSLDAMALIEEVKQHPTLDHFLDKNPHLNRIDYLALLKRLRMERALYIQNESDRKAKRKGEE